MLMLAISLSTARVHPALDDCCLTAALLVGANHHYVATSRTKSYTVSLWAQPSPILQTSEKENYYHALSDCLIGYILQLSHVSIKFSFLLTNYLNTLTHASYPHSRKLRRKKREDRMIHSASEVQNIWNDAIYRRSRHSFNTCAPSEPLAFCAHHAIRSLKQRRR